MSDARGKTYRPWAPEHYRHVAHSPEATLPEDALVVFLLDTVRPLALRRFYAAHEDETRGAPPFAPQMLVCLRLYAYGVGVFSSRKIAQACERHLAFIAMVGEERPDFRTISDCRQLPLAAFGDVFVQVLRIAGEAGLGKLGNVATDGTQLQGNASRHQAMSYGSMKKDVERLRAELEALVPQAYHQDAEDDAALGSRRGEEVPAEVARREDRLATMEAARPRWEARAKAEAEAERQRRAAGEAAHQRTGNKRRGRAPKAVDETPADKAQMSCTDPALRIMQTNKKGWDDWGNAQARVDGAYPILVACDVTAEANDQQQAEPMAPLTVTPLAQADIAIPTDATGATQKMPATYDRGYESEAAAAAVEQLGCEPSMATGRQRPHVLEPQVAETPTTATERMAAQVRTPAGRAVYARRKVIVEPGVGPIKEARGFRRFLLRGLAKIRGEWRLGCLTHNLRKIWRYGWVPSAASHAERSREGHATAHLSRSCPW